MNKRENKGITLIALIITIIVMLILVGVTVNVALNGNLFKNAQDASEGTEKARIDEEIQAMIVSEYDAVTGLVNLGKLAENLVNIEGIESVNPLEGTTKYIETTDKYGRIIRINNDGTLGEKLIEIKYDDPMMIFKVTEISNDEYRIDGLKDGVNLTEISIPHKIDGRFVKNIGDSAFYECTEITKVTIPNSVTNIGNSAFARCIGLTQIELPNSVISIGQYAFMGCTSLTTLAIPSSVINIGDQAFQGCTGITEVAISDSVINIGFCAFNLCTGLIEINVSENNNYYCSENGVLFNKDKTELIKCPEGNVRTLYTIPNTVTSIEYYAFHGCTSLVQVTIPSTVRNIGVYAFYQCTGLVSITIENGIISIGDKVFGRCTRLTQITIPNSVSSIENSAFNMCTGISIQIDNEQGAITGTEPWGAKDATVTWLR